jgi:hypothetical protein
MERRLSSRLDGVAAIAALLLFSPLLSLFFSPFLEWRLRRIEEASRLESRRSTCVAACPPAALANTNSPSTNFRDFWLVFFL